MEDEHERVPFNAKFSEDIMGDLYKKEDARAQIFAAFSLLAVVIGCLGLFGLAAFTAERRTKEIGIRKVLGARDPRHRAAAGLAVQPAGDHREYDRLADRLVDDARLAERLRPADPAHARAFVIAAAIALGIAIATVVGHAVRVARANPIHALRYE